MDLVRPQNVSFQTVMRQHLDKLRAPPQTPQTPQASTTKAPSSTPSWNEAHELRQVNALYSLLENRYAKAHPMPPTLRHPQFKESHYDDVIAEMAQAPGRSWWARVVQRWKGKVRFS